MSGPVLIRPLLVGGRLRSAAGAGVGAGDGSLGGRCNRDSRTSGRSSTLLFDSVVTSVDGEELV